MKNLNLNVISIIAILGAPLLLGACGTNGTRTKSSNSNQLLFLQGDGGQAGNSGAGAGGPSCPYTPNIIPKQEWVYDGKDYFKACVGSNSADVYLQGQSRSHEDLCVFPASKMTNGSVFYKPDLTTGLPLVDCKPADSAVPQQYTFSGVNYNFIFVVTASNKDQMQRCLASGNYYACPITYPFTFSYGQFR